MYTSLPLMYNAEISLPELGQLPSTSREWQNVKREQLKRGLQDPPNESDPRLAEGTASFINLNNSGIQNQSDILKGKIYKPSQYSSTTDLQAYLQLIRDSDREPTQMEIMEANADDIGIDARLINQINEQAREGNYYAVESQNFTRQYQKSFNDFVKESSMFKVPMDLEQQASLQQSVLAGLASGGIKGGEKALLKPVDKLRKQLSGLMQSGKVSAEAISAIANSAGFPQLASYSQQIASSLNSGLSLDKLIRAIERDPNRSLTGEFFSRLSSNSPPSS